MSGVVAPPSTSSSSLGSGFSASTHARYWLWKTPGEVEAIRRRAQVVPRERLRRARMHQQQQQQLQQQQQRATPPVDGDTAMAVESGTHATAAASGSASAAAASDAPPASAVTAATAATSTSSKKKKSSSPTTDDQHQHEPLSLDEERQLRLFYMLQLNTMATMLQLPTHVTHAAILFFQRFFLRQSVMEYSPKDVAYTCIYLACKSEEHHLPLERMIAEITKTPTAAPTPANATVAAPTPAPAAAAAASAASASASNNKTVSTVLSLEVPVLSELKFQLRLYHLARASRGLVKELEETEPLQMSQGIFVHAADPALTSRGAAGTTLQSVGQFLTARALVLHDAAVLTDAIFLYAPAQIALACLAQAEQEAKQFALDAMLDTTALGSVAQGAVKQLNVVQKFIERSAAAAAAAAAGASSASTSSSASSGSSGTPSPSVAVLTSKVRALQSYLTAGLASSGAIDKKALKSIEKRRKAVSNPARDPNSAEAAKVREEKQREKERKRDEKKRGQREEAGRRENALLMDDNDAEATTGGGDGVGGAVGVDGEVEFKLAKRQKGLFGTPLQPPNMQEEAEADAAMKDVEPARSSTPPRGLAAQFADAME